MKRKPKVDWFVSHPIQYFAPLFARLSKTIDLHVYYYSDVSVKGKVDHDFGQEVKWDIPLLKGYNYTFLPNWSKSQSMHSRFRDAFNPRIIKTIFKSKADIIIVNGWSYASDWLVILAAKLAGKKLWLRAETPMNQEERKSKKLRLIKEFLFGKIVFRFFAHKCMYIGTESRKFFEHYKVKSEKLVFTPYAVDNDYFQNSYWEVPEMNLRRTLGLPLDKKIVLYSGKYIDKKRPMDLLEAFRRLNSENYFLVMVGEGQLRSEMETFIRKNNLKNVRLTGFVNQGEIPAYYKVANVFVMCSGMGETWGLSVNEAMIFGTPLLVSRTSGCSVDLVKEGYNGFIFPEGDIEALRDRLLALLEEDGVRMEMGLVSRRVIKDFSIDALAARFKLALDKEIQN